MKGTRIKKFPPTPADFRGRSAPQFPYNEPPNQEKLSKPEYDIKVIRNVKVPMSDGAQLAVDIYMPDKEGKYPALMAISVYTKELQGAEAPTGLTEAGDIEYFVSRGYVHVIADTRGTGHSQGKLDIMGDREAQDGAELIDWIGSQPWCNGNVGMIGMSYFALVQLFIAKKKPPHLKCIFPYDPIYDLYRDCLFHGGLFSFFMPVWTYLLFLIHYKFLRGKRNKDRNFDWKTLLADVRALMTHRRFDNEWMRTHSGYWADGDIDVPVYVGSGWEYAVGLHLRGVFDIFWEAKGPKRMLIGPPQVPARPYRSWRIESLRWYDHWLKGIDTGVKDDPPVNIWIMGRNKWRSENEWPLARTKYVNLYLRPMEKKAVFGQRKMKGKSKIGQLSLNPPEQTEKPLSYLSWPFSLGNIGLPQLVYRTPILRSEVEITGHSVLKLYASCSAKDTYFIVKLCDEAEDGSYRMLTKGWLKASHREIDEERSLPYRPFHPHLKEKKLEPNKIYEYLIEILPVSNLFLTGHRIRLEIACTESPYFEFPYGHPPMLNFGKVKVHSSPQYPSTLVLPTIDSELNFENDDSHIHFEDDIKKWLWVPFSAKDLFK